MSQISIEVEPRTESDLATAALRFARRVHLGQYRMQTGEQFVQHPIAVARLLAEHGFDGPLLAAAYLHDVIEKTTIELEEIRERFGPEVAGLVDCLSEDREIESYGARKRALREGILRFGGDATLIYAADRLANMRDWRKLPPEDRPGCGKRLGTTLEERLELWGEDLEGLRETAPETPFLAELEQELGALRTEAPTPPSAAAPPR